MDKNKSYRNALSTVRLMTFGVDSSDSNHHSTVSALVHRGAAAATQSDARLPPTVANMSVMIACAKMEKQVINR